jgi:hypothetical protein
MNIPLDRLYHYIENIAKEIYGDRVIIYRFWPHGSKNINNLNNLNDECWIEKIQFPLIWCCDQEPLDHEYYRVHIRKYDSDFSKILKLHKLFRYPKNLKFQQNMFEKGLLLHSEKRSHNINKYQLDEELLPVYYWSHATISRDWFRFAEHVTQKKQVQKTFLVYNRAWSGTREYRLRFAEHLIKLSLENHCQTSINPIEPELGIHYKLHKFKKPTWQPSIVLEDYFSTSTAHSHYSADFDIKDYEATDIEVVLETLFDDDRLHLTEKSLRPIACGQPFVLVGTHGSLEYLRSYGFKTFGDIWNEQYDLVEDPEERLIHITNLMQNIVNWTPSQRAFYMEQAQKIADFNRQWFFSQYFFDLVINELKTNLKLAFNELNQCNNYQSWVDYWKKLITHPEVVKFLNTNQHQLYPTIDTVNQAMLIAQTRLTEVANNDKR